jgi:hypothetical protein
MKIYMNFCKHLEAQFAHINLSEQKKNYEQNL